MISETYFVQNHTSLWRILAPTTDLFVRRLNKQLYIREYPPIKSATNPSRNALVNEVSFILFGRTITEQSLQLSDHIQEATSQARSLISGIEHLRPDQIRPLDDNEMRECFDQVRRLRTFFRSISGGNPIEVSPKFSGCGIIDSCFGDVYLPGTLFEVKAGQRPFRSTDIRQLLTYAALNKAANSRPLTNVGLFNPRMGTSFQMSLDELCFEVSGSSHVEFLEEIIRVISSGDISR